MKKSLSILKIAIRFVLLTGIMVSLISCEKEKFVNHQWKPLDDFLYAEKIQLNGIVADDKFYTIGLRSFTEVNANEDSTLFTSLHSILGFEYLIDYKLPVASRIFAGYNTYGVGFYSARNPVMGGTYKWIYINHFDTAFAGFCFPPYWSSEAMVINNNNQCLIPYSYYTTYLNTSSVHLEPRFIVANLEVSETYAPGEDYVDTLSCHQLIFDGVMGQPVALHTFEDFFIVTGATHTVKISGDLTMTKIYDGRLYKIIQSNNEFFAFTAEELLKSVDNGFTWTSVALTDNIFSRLCYSWIQNKLIGSYYNQLFEITINDQGVSGRELNSEGLEGNLITSVNLFKGKVFITTLSGVFTKDIDNFFEYAD